MKKLTFIVPCYNALPNLPLLLGSLVEQHDTEWNAIFVDDVSTDGTLGFLRGVADPRVSVIANTEKKFALHNIVSASRSVAEGVIAVIDGDDQLCNPDTVSLVKAAHATLGTVAWTAHRWDVNGLNVSKEMPARVNPYQYQWCSSHLRTFDASLLQRVPDANFKDQNGKWFERGYDQALMLPLIYKSDARVYIPDVCYLYKINSCSIVDRDWAERKQLQTVNFVRARGFVNG
jgi:glycosyltransferase involved in cell wall biosynthesis